MAPAAADLAVGDAVEGSYRGGGAYYPGKISAVLEGGFYDVDYDDGDADKGLSAEHVRRAVPSTAPWEPTRGSAVECRYKTTPKFYPGVVQSIDSGAFIILFDDGEQEVGVERRRLRLAGQRQRAKLEVGEVVDAKHESGKVRRGKVMSEGEDDYTIKFDNGDEATLQRKFIFAEFVGTADTPSSTGLLLPVGTPVQAKYQGAGQWFTGTITARDEDEGTYAIAYDDGDKDPSLKPEHVLLLDPLIGKAVECRYKQQPKFYPGKVASFENESYTVSYADGDSESGVLRRRIRFPGEKQGQLKKGDKVDARSKNGKVLPATVLTIENLSVEFEDGEVAELERKFIFAEFAAPLSLQVSTDDSPQQRPRRPPSMNKSPVRSLPDPTVLFDPTVALAKWAVGSIVEAKFRGEGKLWFSGKVVGINAGLYEIAYDDGDKDEALPCDCIRAKSVLGVGVRCECRYGKKPRFYPGVVSAVSEGLWSVDYDDGEKETMLPSRRIKLPGQRQRSKLHKEQLVDARSESGKVLPGRITCVTSRSIVIEKETHRETVYTVQFDDGEVATDMERKFIFAEFIDLQVANAASDDDDSSTASSTLLLDVGSPVEGKYHGKGQWFKGKVSAINVDGAYDITYDDGDVDQGLAAEFVRAILATEQPKATPPPGVASPEQPEQPGVLLAVGTPVEGKYKGKGQWFKGKVAAINDGTYDLAYDDGDVDQGLAAEFVRAILTEQHPKAATPSAVSSPEQQPGVLLTVGTPVEGKYKGKGQWFKGKVAAVNDGSYDLAYEDGDVDQGLAAEFVRAILTEQQPKAATPPDVVVASPEQSEQPGVLLAVGTPVEGKYKGKGQWFKGKVAAVNDGAYDLAYDDGDVDQGLAAEFVRAILATEQPKATTPPDAVVVASPEPPGAFLAVGTPVEGKYKGKGQWFKGKVAAVNDGFYDLAYDDGDADQGLAPEFVRALTAAAPAVPERVVEASAPPPRAPKSPPPPVEKSPPGAKELLVIQSPKKKKQAPEDLLVIQSPEKQQEQPFFEAPAPPDKPKLQLTVEEGLAALRMLRGDVDLEKQTPVERTPVRTKTSTARSKKTVLLPNEEDLGSGVVDDDIVANIHVADEHEAAGVHWAPGARGLGGAAGLVYTPCGRVVAAAHRSRVGLWLSRSGRQLGDLCGHSGRVVALASCRIMLRSSIRPVLASGGSDGVACVWALPDDRKLDEADDDEDDKDLLLEEQWQAWPRQKMGKRAPDLGSRRNWERLEPLMKHRHPKGTWVLGVDLSITGLLATSASDSRIRIFHTQKQGTLKVLEEHSWYATQVRFNPAHPQILASSSMDKTVKLWWHEEQEEPETPSLNPPESEDFEDGATFASSKIVETKSTATTMLPSAKTRTLQCGSAVHSIAWTPDGSTLLAGCDRGAPLLFKMDPATNEPLSLSEQADDDDDTGHEGAVVALAVSAEGGFFASASHDGSAMLWSTAPTQTAERPKLVYAMSCVRTGGRFVGLAIDDGCFGLSHTGSRRRRPRIATLSADGSVRSWHAPTSVLGLVEGRCSLVARMDACTHMAAELRSTLKAALVTKRRDDDLTPSDLASALKLLVRAAMRELPKFSGEKSRDKNARRKEAEVSAALATKLAKTLAGKTLDLVLDELVAESHICVGAAFVQAQLHEQDPKKILASILEHQSRQRLPLLPQFKRWRLAIEEDDDSLLKTRCEAAIVEVEGASLLRLKVERQGEFCYLRLIQRRHGFVDYDAVERVLATDVAAVERRRNAPPSSLQLTSLPIIPSMKKQEPSIPASRPVLVPAVSTVEWYIVLQPDVVSVVQVQELIDEAKIDIDATIAVLQLDGSHHHQIRVTYPSHTLLPQGWLEEQLISVFEGRPDLVKWLHTSKPTSRVFKTPLTVVVDWCIVPAASDVKAEQVQAMISELEFDDASLKVIEDGDLLTLRITHDAKVRPPLGWLEEALTHIFEEHAEVIASLQTKKPAVKEKLQESLTNKKTALKQLEKPPSQESPVEWVIRLNEAVDPAHVQSLIDAALGIELDGAKLEVLPSSANNESLLRVSPDEKGRLPPLGWLEEALTDVFEPHAQVMMKIASLQTEKQVALPDAALQTEKQVPAPLRTKMVEWRIKPAGAGLKARDVQSLIDASLDDFEATLTVVDGPDCLVLHITFDADKRPPLEWLEETLLDVFQEAGLEVASLETQRKQQPAEEETAHIVVVVEWQIITAAKEPGVIQQVVDDALIADEDLDLEVTADFRLRATFRRSASPDWLEETLLEAFGQTDLVASLHRIQKTVLEWQLVTNGATVAELQGLVDTFDTEGDFDLKVVDGEPMRLLISHAPEKIMPLEWLEETLLEVLETRPDLVMSLRTTSSTDNGAKPTLLISKKQQRWRLLVDDPVDLEGIQAAIDTAETLQDLDVNIAVVGEEHVMLLLTTTDSREPAWDWLYETLLDVFQENVPNVRAIERPPTSGAAPAPGE